MPYPASLTLDFQLLGHQLKSRSDPRSEKLVDKALTAVLIVWVLVSGGAIGHLGYRLFRDKMHRPISVGFGVIAGVVVATHTADVLLSAMSLF